MFVINLTNPAPWFHLQLYLKPNSSLNHTNLWLPHCHLAKLSGNKQLPLLGDNEHIAIGTLKCAVLHALIAVIHINAHPFLFINIIYAHLWGSRHGQGHHPFHEILLLFEFQWEWFPSELIGTDHCLHILAYKIRIYIWFLVLGVFGWRQYPVQPGELILVSGGREGWSWELFRVEIVVVLLRGVLATGQGVR